MLCGGEASGATIIRRYVNDMFNWLSQIANITLFNLRSLPERKGAAFAAAAGTAGVVAVFVGVLSIASGFRAAMTPTGAGDLAVVLRSGADTEMTSVLSSDDSRVIADAPGVARSTNGALAAGELFVIINLPKRSTGTDERAFQGRRKKFLRRA